MLLVLYHITQITCLRTGYEKQSYCMCKAATLMLHCLVSLQCKSKKHMQKVCTHLFCVTSRRRSNVGCHRPEAEEACTTQVSMSVHLILRLLSHEGMHRARENRVSTHLFWFSLPTAPAQRHPSLHHTGGHESREANNRAAIYFMLCYFILFTLFFFILFLFILSNGDVRLGN